jgi:hypothetical protein
VFETTDADDELYEVLSREDPIREGIVAIDDTPTICSDRISLERITDIDIEELTRPTCR